MGKSRHRPRPAGPSGDADAKPKRRPPQHERKRRGGDERDQNADMRVEARQLPEPRARRHNRRLQEPGTRTDPAAPPAPAARERATKFSRSVTSTSWTRRPRWIAVAIAAHSAPSAAAPTAKPRRHKGGSRPVKRGRRSAEPAERNLALGADVDDAGAEAKATPDLPANRAWPD